MKTLIKDFLTIFSTLLTMLVGLIAMLIYFSTTSPWYIWVPCMLISTIFIGPSYLFWKEKFSSLWGSKI